MAQPRIYPSDPVRQISEQQNWKIVPRYDVLRHAGRQNIYHITNEYGCHTCNYSFLMVAVPNNINRNFGTCKRDTVQDKSCDRAKCSEFPSTRCVNHCSLHSSRVVTRLNCNCPIGIAGKFASCFWSRVEFRLFPTLRVGIRKANQEFLHLNMRNHNSNPTSIWTRKIIQQWVNVVNIETVPRSSSSNCSQKPRIEAVKPCRGTRMSSNASSPTHKFSCAHQVLQWNCHLADQT